MQQVDSSKRIREIEDEIDNYFRSHRFMQLPCPIAIQYLLMVYEDANRLPLLSGANILTSEFKCFALIDNNRNALTQSIDWASKITKSVSEEIIIDIDKNIYTNAVTFFDLAYSYDRVVSAYTMWSRGVAEATLVNENTVCFKYLEEEARYDMLAMRLLVENSDEFHTIRNSHNDIHMINAKTAIENSVIQTSQHSISYSTSGINYEEITKISLEMIKRQTIPPSNWRFYGLATESFERFWSALLSICILHHFALFYAATKMKMKSGAVESTIIVHTVGSWIRELSRWTGLSNQIVLQILQYHIYSRMHKKPDIAITPFIFITGKQLALAPTLITSSNLGRNLLKHLANNYSNEYDNNSFVFEGEMIFKFCNSIKSQHFEIYPKRRIPDKAEFPDIDICLLDKANQQVMLCEFKWTIPAAEPYEILEKREKEAKALDQLGLLKEYFRDNPTIISNILEYDGRIMYENMFFVGVLENCVGTDYMFNKDIPIIEYSIFCKLLNENESLEEVFKCIEERKFLPKENFDYESKEINLKIGKFEIVWEGFADK